MELETQFLQRVPLDVHKYELSPLSTELRGKVFIYQPSPRTEDSRVLS